MAGRGARQGRKGKQGRRGRERREARGGMGGRGEGNASGEESHGENHFMAAEVLENTPSHGSFMNVLRFKSGEGRVTWK